MIKIVLAGVWACIATLVAVYFSVQLATAPAPADDGNKKPELELVRGEAVTIPVFSDGSVKGYFLCRFSFMVQKEKVESIKLPLPPMMTDELYRLLVDNKIVDLTQATKLDVEGFRNTIKADLNKHLGDGVIAEVLVEQLDYLAKAETQDGGGKPKLKPAVKIVEGQDPAAKTAEKSGH